MWRSFVGGGIFIFLLKGGEEKRGRAILRFRGFRCGDRNGGGGGFGVFGRGVV